jgi:hypothetical protein
MALWNRKDATTVDILTIAYNLNYETHNRFVGSLLNTGFSGTCNVVSSPSDTETIDKIHKKYTSKNINYIIEDSRPNYNITTQKFFWYPKYITNINSQYIFVCDFSDVFFQQNLENYHYDPEIDIYASLEDQFLYQDTQYTSQWIKWTEQLLNVPIYDQIKHYKIICSGTTLGKTDAIKSYLNNMFEILSLTTEYLRWRVYDQGVHNYLLRLNTKCKVKFIDNTETFVCTMGNQKISMNNKNRRFYNNKIVNEKNEPYYVLHQYNRMLKKDQNLLFSSSSLED